MKKTEEKSFFHSNSEKVLSDLKKGSAACISQQSFKRPISHLSPLTFRLRGTPKRRFGATAAHPAAFTLVEVMVSAAIFVFAMTGIFLAYGQAVRMLDGLRQTSRSEDILLANVEFLRTRSWGQLTNLVITTTGGTPTAWSSNLTESGSVVSATNSPTCSHLELMTADPLNIGLKAARRNLVITGYPNGLATDTMRQCTVILSWTPMRGTGTALTNNMITNTMTVYFTKGGMTADITQ